LKNPELYGSGFFDARYVEGEPIKEGIRAESYPSGAVQVRHSIFDAHRGEVLDPVT
jgi:hypothetical protein